MKKIAVCVMAMLVAGLCQAGQIQWLFANVKDPGDNTKAGIGYLCLFMRIGDTVTRDDIANRLATRGDDFTSLALHTELTDQNGRVNVTFGNFVRDETVEAFTVILDADNWGDANNYIMSANKSFTFGDIGNGAFAIGNIVKDYTWSKIGSSGSGSGDEPIPEPATAALLAIGLAAVGLKRKARA